ncbi:MAG: ATP-binding protein [Oscillospiraceae bacterium]|jgi:AAA+ superfamily predicted ATPase|nr:ATP-binding protein [Oscillospiraceae bacterium]
MQWEDNQGKNDLYFSYFNEEDIEKAYSSNDEYLEDITILLDLHLEAIFHLLEESNNKEGEHESALFTSRGLVVSNNELSRAITVSQREKRAQQSQMAIAPALKRAWEHIEERIRKTHIRLPMAEFFEKQKLSLFERFCVITNVAVGLNRKYERLFACLQDDNTAKLPTFGLAFTLTSLIEGTSNTDIYKLCSSSLLSSLFVGLGSEAKLPLMMTELLLKPQIFNLFVGVNERNRALREFVEYHNPVEPLDDLVVGAGFNEKLFKATKAMLELELPNRIIHIFGEDGAGKRFHVKHVAKKLEMAVALVDFTYLISVELENAISLAEIIAFDAMFNQKLICLYNLNLKEGNMPSISLIFDALLMQRNIIFALNNSSRFPASEYSRHKPLMDFEITQLNLAESLKVWEELAKAYEFTSPVNFKEISNKFHYTPGQASDILQRAKMLSGGRIKGDILKEVCRTFSVHNLEKKATIINCHYTLNDLVIDESQKKILENACNYIRYKDVVYESWGFSSKISYGKGLSMVFFGPPGTGKTMGAQVVANELDLQLYKVDISQIANKYIGETEKNLKDVFAEAKVSNSILLFDEADSLFGKRTDAKNANDKFSNNEISFLLQQMEDYDGISILTTNKFNHFDDAFRRRIKFIVNFPAPTLEMRKLLWDKIFPDIAPLGEDFDPLMLAERFDLNGSSIKSIAIAAAYLAAEKGAKITMSLLLEAVKYEYQKLGKILPDECCLL